MKPIDEPNTAQHLTGDGPQPDNRYATLGELQQAKVGLLHLINRMCDTDENLIAIATGHTATIAAIHEDIDGMREWANNVEQGMQGTKLRLDAFYDWVSAGMYRITALEDCARLQGLRINQLEDHVKALEAKTEGTSTRMFGSLGMHDKVVTRDT